MIQSSAMATEALEELLATLPPEMGTLLLLGGRRSALALVLRHVREGFARIELAPVDDLHRAVAACARARPARPAWDAALTLANTFDIPMAEISGGYVGWIMTRESCSSTGVRGPRLQ